MTPLILIAYGVVCMLAIFAAKIYYRNKSYKSGESWREYYHSRERDALNKLTLSESELVAVKTKFTVETERGKMLESELEKAYELIEQYRTQSNESLDLIRKWAELQEKSEPEALRKIASLKPDEVIECKDIPTLEAVCKQAINENIEDAESVLSTIKDELRMPVCISYGRVAKNTLNYGYKYYYEEKGCTVLPASKFVEVEKVESKPEQVEKFEQLKIDRPIESYKPFPKGYVIPEGTRVIVVSESRAQDSEYYTKVGSIGEVLYADQTPMCSFDGIVGGRGMHGYELAPLDDRDHPEHPEFHKP